MLTIKRLKDLLSYDPETGIFTWRVSRQGHIKAGMVAGTVGKDGYRYIKIDGVQYNAHRLAWFYTYGRWPSVELDHIKGDRDNNRIKKLREATHIENRRNHQRYLNNTSGVTGVYWHKLAKKWRAQIAVSGKVIYLGCSSIFEEAVAMRQNAEILYFGEFRRAS